MIDGAAPVRPRQPRHEADAEAPGARTSRSRTGWPNALAEIDALPERRRAPFCKVADEFLDGLVSHYVLDDGKLVVAHAGMKAEMQGRGSGKVRDFALYGETTGETDEFGLPVRYNWAAEYRGRRWSSTATRRSPNRSGSTAPSTSTPAASSAASSRPCATRRRSSSRSPPPEPTANRPGRSGPETSRPPSSTAQQAHDAGHAEDVLGKRIVSTRLRGNVTIREEHATAALEVMSRFAADPKWLIYLPPTMSPCETPERAGLLEHPPRRSPTSAARVRRRSSAKRSTWGRGPSSSSAGTMAARERFGVSRRPGESSSPAPAGGSSTMPTLSRFLDRVRTALTAADLWTELETMAGASTAS